MFITAAVIGWFIAGAVATACLVTFWDEVKNWLNQVAADAVERVLGYGARERMHRAIAVMDRVVNKIRNTSTIYTKRNDYDTYFDKTTIVSDCNEYEIDRDVLKEVSKRNQLVQEFGYKNH